MSGPFALGARYEADDGTVYRIRVQPETLAANIGGTNSSAAGQVDGTGTVRVGGGNRRFGIKARAVSVRFTADPPEGYDGGEILRIPILTPDRYDTISLGSTGSYLGAAVEVVGKSPERVR